jgi:hypothetical protein
MRIKLRVALPVAIATAALVAGPVVVASAAGSKPHVCSGALGKPGVISGTYKHGVVVKGACFVNAGPTKVIGNLTVTKGSAFAAAFGLNDRTHKGHSNLTVTGSVLVGKGATVVLGCKVNSNGSGFPCIDDPHPHKPTLKGTTTIEGNITEKAPLGVVVHNSQIDGGWSETGGGGGLNCNPTGPFKKFKSPVYSNIEDSTVEGNLTISGMKTCWVGVARVHIAGNATFTNNDLADPDGVEIVSNHIDGNLGCTGNSHPPGTPAGAQPVWDSGDQTMNLYPRVPQPNTVNGTRSGQCVLASPATMGGPLGPGAF